MSSSLGDFEQYIAQLESENTKILSHRQQVVEQTKAVKTAAADEQINLFPKLVDS